MALSNVSEVKIFKDTVLHRLYEYFRSSFTILLDALIDIQS